MTSTYSVIMRSIRVPMRVDLSNGTRRYTTPHHGVPNYRLIARLAPFNGSLSPIKGKEKPCRRMKASRHTTVYSAEASDQDLDTNGGEDDIKVTGEILKSLIVNKWDRMHQVTINRIREGIPLINAKFFFCLEVDWHYVNQLGFEMTEEEYDKEMSSVALCLNAFDLSADDVTELFDQEKKKPSTGAAGSNKGFSVVRIKLPVDAYGF